MPVRATVASFGPVLLSKVLGLNATQESTLGLIFHWAKEANRPLVTLNHLRSVISHLTSDEGKDDLKDLGGVSSTTAGVILRALVNLDGEGGDTFFGEPKLDPQDLLRVDDQGHGIISLLEFSGQSLRPVIFSTFLMWVLADLFTVLPEVGDVDKPKLVFFFDEAHLLVHRRLQGFPRAGRTDRQADPLQGRRGVLLHPVAHGSAQRCAVPAGCPGPARAAGVHPRRPEGAEQDRPHLPENRCLRPGIGVDVAGNRRGRRDRAVREGRTHTGRVDTHAGTPVADGRYRHRRDHRRGQIQPAAS